MKSLRSLPGFLKRHYEKFLLGLALIALAGAVVVLNQQKEEENRKIEEYEKGIPKRKGNPVQTVDLSVLSSAMMHATNPPALNFSPPHNLFNPVKWQRRSDGTMLKVETGKEIGPDALQITKIGPLNLIITVDSQSGSGVTMSVTQEAHTNRAWRVRMQSFLTTNNVSERTHRSRVFKVSDFKVTPDGPEVEVELADGSKHTITTAKPFSRIDGYRVDLSYPPEKGNFTDLRVGDVLNLTGEAYIIVAITPNEIVVSARSNDRRTTIRTNAVP